MDPLIKSQLLYQLSYAPCEKAGVLAKPGGFVDTQGRRRDGDAPRKTVCGRSGVFSAVAADRDFAVNMHRHHHSEAEQ